MGAWKKTVKCIKCGKEMHIKSFRHFGGKYIFGKGYLCAECLKAGKNSQAKTKPAEIEAK